MMISYYCLAGKCLHEWAVLTTSDDLMSWSTDTKKLLESKDTVTFQHIYIHT